MAGDGVGEAGRPPEEAAATDAPEKAELADVPGEAGADAPSGVAGPSAAAEEVPAPAEIDESLAERPFGYQRLPGQGAPRRRWRRILRALGVGAIVLALAAAGGFGAALLVPILVDVPPPTGTLPPTPSVPLVTLAPTASPAPQASAGGSPSSTRSSSASARPSATTNASGQVVYVVQRGDTLAAIAAGFGVTAQAIAAANNLADPNHIEPGQRLVIPTP